ncbi:Protein dip1 [Talaromyces islandicus]|uniref:Protein dip1 n=1 Tax=Talaromyces islandicus TaxID=28573 RepID=A0A0U1LYB1_TALIS|nr:Protein dip1 [Talaromyces islandicus]
MNSNSGMEDDPDTLHFMAAFLLFDGRHNDTTFQLMNEEGCFSRLLELVRSQSPDVDDGAGLHRLLMDLLYEMSRIQRVKIEDLVLVEDEFVKYLFEIIEGLSNDANDPYHYHVIRVLVSPRSHKIARETSLQLLTLKLLYLIFTTPSTYEYFYTNDLRVLVDILIRNLLDLPEDSVALRHTYLRVFYPLLAHTQLQHPPHYKKDEIKRTLGLLVHSQFDGEEYDYERILHFAEADETTKRLVARCSQVEWLHDPKPALPEESAPDGTGIPIVGIKESDEGTTIIAASPASQDSVSVSLSPTKVNSRSPTTPTSFSRHQAERLGMHLEPASASTLSVMEVAAQNEKPGVMTPSRKDTRSSDQSFDAILSVRTKQKPEPPKARRSRGQQAREEDEGGGEKLSVDLGENSLASSASTKARSTSRPPAPALPPPRRSAHPMPAAVTVDGSSLKPSVKPEPPKTRRWRHGQKPPTEPSMGGEVEKA